MPKLVSMKIDKSERERMTEPQSLAGEGPIYPYGLSLSLDNDSLKKLGIDTLPEVGETRILIARVKVNSVSSNETPRGKNQNVSLQITDAGLEDAGEKVDAAAKLYEE